MSGHNKWSKVKHKKAAADAEKSKIFSRLSMLITLESRKARGDVSAPGIKTAIEKAKQVNMPGENIERAIKKGVAVDLASLDAISYEAYGPGGCALIIETLTDNRNRTSAQIKQLLSEHGLSLSLPGTATWTFEKEQSGWKAKMPITLSTSDAEKLTELVSDLGEQDDVQGVYTNARAADF